jgi:hypothetical protein
VMLVASIRSSCRLDGASPQLAEFIRSHGPLPQIIILEHKHSNETKDRFPSPHRWSTGRQNLRQEIEQSDGLS